MRTAAASIGLFALVTLVGCGADGDDAPAPVDVTVAFTSPTAGATLSRDVLEPGDGWVAAPVAIQLAVAGAPAVVEVTVADELVGVADPAGAVDGFLRAPGATTLTATARDADGLALATATVDVTVVDPELATCRAWLDHYGVAYQVGPANPGVDDPVTVATPINGMPFRYLGNSGPRPRFFMDCALARSLVRAAPHWRSRGVVEVQDLGVYNYRCIGGGTPPDCPNGISQHAYAKAIDLAAFVHADGTTYTVATDWVIDPADDATCTAATDGAKDTWLHQLICALKADHAWTIVLTPNYNAAHRDHFHVDLTDGADFLRDLPPIDHGPDGH
ncbi:MAG: extensin family protein [Kofleriaceae bacterium]